jgi:transcription elongation factor Elf1
LTQGGMKCAKCGAEMNHQADKLVHPVTRAEAAEVTVAFDGVIEELFACPSCGWIESRRTGARRY